MPSIEQHRSSAKQADDALRQAHEQYDLASQAYASDQSHKQWERVHAAREKMMQAEVVAAAHRKALAAAEIVHEREEDERVLREAVEFGSGLSEEKFAQFTASDVKDVRKAWDTLRAAVGALGGKVDHHAAARREFCDKARLVHARYGNIACAETQKVISALPLEKDLAREIARVLGVSVGTATDLCTVLRPKVAPITSVDTALPVGVN